MNKILFEQLKKVSVTNIEFDENTTELTIPKTIKILNSSMKKGQTYTIELEDFIVVPHSGSTLASNWNNGVIPKYKRYIVEVIDNMAKMIKVNGVAIDNNMEQFIGWLPIDGFTIISKE